MNTPAEPGQRGRDRPLFGLRRRPGRLALALFRLPLNAYRHDAGRLMGRTFLQFTHVGRKTGQPHDAVAMVLRYDEASREAVICAAWGPATDWVRNLRAGPARKVQLGSESFTPRHRVLGEDEAFDVAVQSACRWGLPLGRWPRAIRRAGAAGPHRSRPCRCRRRPDEAAR